MTEQAPKPNNAGASVREAVDAARRIVNRRLLVRSLAIACTAVGAAACVAAASFAIAGTGVPLIVYAVAVVLLAGTTAALWLACRRDETRVAATIDDKFALRDGVRTAVAFESASDVGGYETLQTHWTRDRLCEIDASKLVAPPRGRLLASAIALPVIAMLLGFAPESEAVKRERAQRADTIALAEELNKGIKDMVEEELASADEEEAEHLDPDEVRELVDKLEASSEEAELLRQYAEMEQELASKAASLDAASLEGLLAEAAAQLSSSPESADLGEALSQQNLEQAARELDEFKLKAEVSEEALDRKRAELKKLASLAKRLAEAARKHDARGSRASSTSTNSDSRQATSSANGDQARDGRVSEGDAVDREMDEAERLAQQIRELEEAVREAEESLGKCSNGQCTSSDLDRLARSSRNANDSLQRMSDSLRRSSARRSAQSRLSRMASMLSRSQSAVAGQRQSPFAGGQQAGQGSSDRQRDGQEREDGQGTELAAGAKSSGPSQTSIEEADSGDGVSGLRGSATTADFARQFESFIERPDVPAEVKDGVKLYLENIHRSPESDEGDDSKEDGSDA
ncbi:MAG: hypothetical protein AAF747_04525 [Planctomycetota bacterium]